MLHPVLSTFVEALLTYYLELLRALSARKHPTAKQRSWGRSLLAVIAVGIEESAVVT